MARRVMGFSFQSTLLRAVPLQAERFLLYRYEPLFFENLCKRVLAVGILGATVLGLMGRRKMMKWMEQVLNLILDLEFMILGYVNF